MVGYATAVAGGRGVFVGHGVEVGVSVGVLVGVAVGVEVKVGIGWKGVAVSNADTEAVNIMIVLVGLGVPVGGTK